MMLSDDVHLSKSIKGLCLSPVVSSVCNRLHCFEIGSLANHVSKSTMDTGSGL